MAWPHLITLNIACPDCGKTGDVEVIHQPYQRVYGSRDRIYRSFTWAECSTCRHQWQLHSSLAREALPAA
jgi:hypothetical protein